MTIGIGIDAVEIAKCVEWIASRERLKRIFSDSEIAYCFSVEKCIAQRLAARFAVREAFFKALHSAKLSFDIPFLTLCKQIEVKQVIGSAPILVAHWDQILTKGSDANPLQTRLSITHTSQVAIAYVMLVDLVSELPD